MTSNDYADAAGPMSMIHGRAGPNQPWAEIYAELIDAEYGFGPRGESVVLAEIRGIIHPKPGLVYCTGPRGELASVELTRLTNAMQPMIELERLTQSMGVCLAQVHDVERNPIPGLPHKRERIIVVQGFVAMHSGTEPAWRISSP